MQDANGPTLLADIILRFVNDSPGHLENIRRAIDNHDAKLVDASAHRFLSSIENLGALRMRKHCMELERMGRSGVLAGTTTELDSLRPEFDTALEHLRGESSA